MRQVPIYTLIRNKLNLVLNYCKHNFKENYSCVFHFYTLEEGMFFVLSESSLAGIYLEVVCGD